MKRGAEKEQERVDGVQAKVPVVVEGWGFRYRDKWAVAAWLREPD